jgi:hypothetical protein
VSEKGAGRPQLFADRRQARGWLLSQWSIYAVAAVVWARLLLQLTDTGDDRVPPVLVVVVLLALAGAGGWSFWVSRGIRAELAEAVREHHVTWWQRDRFLAEQAAERLAWPPTLVVGIGRGLILLAVVLMVIALALGLTAA